MTTCDYIGLHGTTYDFPNIIINKFVNTIHLKFSFVAKYTTSNRDLLNMEGRQDSNISTNDYTIAHITQ